MNKEELLKKEGVYEKDGKICFHLSPIRNWYSMMDKIKITCPICKKHILTIEYPPNFKKDPIQKGIVIYCHRAIIYECPICSTKFMYENFD